MPAFLESNGRLGRGLFAFRFFATLVVWAALAVGVVHYAGYVWPRAYEQAEFRADIGQAPEAPAPGAAAKPHPSYELAGFDGHAFWQVSVFLAIVISLYGLGMTLVQIINRLRDLGWPGWYCLFFMLPLLIEVLLLQAGNTGIWAKIVALPAVLLVGALLFLPGRPGKVEEHGH